MSDLTCNLDCDRAFLNEELFSTHVQTVHPTEFASASDEAKAPAGANAPYKIVPVGDKFAVKNNAGETKATFATKAKANDYLQALYANVKGAAKRADKVPFTGKAKNRVPAPKTAKAELEVACVDKTCERAFLTEGAMQEHAEAVHTFDDIRTLVSDKIRATYGRKGDYRATPPIPSIWTWVVDMAEDWVVFSMDGDSTDTLRKASYTITDDNEVTLGVANEVVRKTVYEPVKQKASI